MTGDLMVMLEERRVYEVPPGTSNLKSKTNVTVGCGNYIQFPPLYPQYIFEDVFANRIVGTILSNILGPQPELRYLGTNSVRTFDEMANSRL